MPKRFERTIMIVASLSGFGGLTTTVVEAAVRSNITKLFRKSQDNWLIRKEDLEKEEDTFYKLTNHNNIIELSKSNNSVRNIIPLTGLESVTITSSNSFYYY